MQLLSGCLSCVMAVALSQSWAVLAACAHDLKPGQYVVDVSIEYPNLTDPIDRRVVHLCLSDTALASHAGFRILSNVPQATCPTIPLCFGQGRAGFQALCPGANSGEATGEFTYRDKTFTGVVQMKFGGKNMTVVERQNGVWVGDCPAEPVTPADSDVNAR